MSCGIGLAGAIAIPTTLMSSCSKQSPQTIKIMFNVTTNSIQILSYTLFENNIPTKKVIVSNKFVNPTIVEQLKELENNGTYKFYFEKTSQNELTMYTLNEFIFQFASYIAD